MIDFKCEPPGESPAGIMVPRINRIYWNKRGGQGGGMIGGSTWYKDIRDATKDPLPYTLPGDVSYPWSEYADQVYQSMKVHADGLRRHFPEAAAVDTFHVQVYVFPIADIIDRNDRLMLNRASGRGVLIVPIKCGDIFGWPSERGLCTY